MTKEPTEKQLAARKANSERLKAKHAAAREAKTVDLQIDPIQSPVMQAPQSDMTDLVIRLLREVEDLKKNSNVATVSPDVKLEELAKMQGAAHVGVNGVQGVVYKYPIDKGFYPDPTARLIAEDSLRRFAMQENFIFKWDVTGVIYEKYNVTYAEPRFTIELYRRAFNDDGSEMFRVTENGVKVPQMILINRCILHEDEMTARVAANKLNLPSDNFTELMDEVRYMRIRDWLFDLFRPADIKTYNRQSRTMVINGKAVEVFDSEVLTDHDSGVSKADSINRQSGVGKVQI